MEEKVEQLKAQCVTACKLANMVFYGQRAEEEYEKNPNGLMAVSNYGLWGKWYEEKNGWHRGIDVCPGGNVHAICPGEVIYKEYYYLNIYYQNFDVTITYMHLQIGQADNGTTFTIEIGDRVETGQILGKQSNLGPGVQPNHTHLEFNSGRYCPENKERWDLGNSVARPMSQDTDGKNILLGEISEGCNFSNNPYNRYIIPIWEERQ